MDESTLIRSIDDLMLASASQTTTIAILYEAVKILDARVARLEKRELKRT